jgi:hypothetical protein
MKNPIHSIKRTATKTKAKLVAAYEKDPEQFMQTVLYATVITFTVIGGGLKVADRVSSYRSKTAYAKMMNARYPQ